MMKVAMEDKVEFGSKVVGSFPRVNWNLVVAMLEWGSIDPISLSPSFVTFYFSMISPGSYSF